MKRGDIVTVAMQGDYGKPRPAVVVESDNFAEHPSVVLLPISSTLVDAPLFRVAIEPSEENGLNKPSQVMVDKITTYKKERVGNAFGSIEHAKMVEIERALVVFIGLG